MRNLVFVILLLCAGTTLWAQEDNKYTDPVEQMARFPGGEDEMNKFINDRLFYPWKGDSIKGKVVCRFIVNKFGDTENIEILRGLNPLADSLSVSIIRQMPRWIPATQLGIPVSISYVWPIVFDPEKIDADKKLNTTSSVMPSFKGGDVAMYKFIRENFKYPKSVCEMGLQGSVIIQFIIDSKGKVWHPYVYRSLHPDFDTEALRVVGMMPDWEPLKNSEGCHLFTLPINFRMKR